MSVVEVAICAVIRHKSRPRQRDGDDVEDPRGSGGGHPWSNATQPTRHPHRRRFAGTETAFHGQPPETRYRVTAEPHDAWVSSQADGRGGTADCGRAGVPTTCCSRGEFFGAIALLRDIPRIANVSATTTVQTLALGRADFLAAISSHAHSGYEAERVVADRLALRVSAVG
jgi:hypothetical protein